jgi:hypothetical protein
VSLTVIDVAFAGTGFAAEAVALVTEKSYPEKV